MQQPIEYCCSATEEYREGEILSEHEKNVLGHVDVLKNAHPRVYQIVKSFENTTPRLDIQRGLYFTQSMKATLGQPLVLRWAKALYHIAENIEVYIDDNQLLAGRIGAQNTRYGILYPEVEGDFYRTFLSSLSSREGNHVILTDEDHRVINEEIGPFWEERTYHENFTKALPEDIRDFLFLNEEGTESRYLVQEQSGYRSSLQWVHDYGTAIDRGFAAIREESQARLDKLDRNNPKDVVEKKPFLEAMVIVCDAIMLWARRHAELARSMAADEKDPVRREELLVIAENCEQVPAYPAKNFHQAVQSQWFVQMFSRLEQRTGTTISNGRMDQYLYPMFRQDMEKGTLTEEKALELLECMWAGMSQFVELYISSQANAFFQGYAHWEAVTVGGQDRNGNDVTNELSHLLLKSKREFPSHYPDLAARVHSRTPDSFLADIAETIKYGSGFPKLLNDEEVIPLLVSQGAPMADALDYSVSGCTEVRMPNRDTYTSGGGMINLAAIIELVLNNGRMKKYGDKLLGVETGDPRNMKTWDEFWEAVKAQLNNFMRIIFTVQYVINKQRPRHFAQPMASALHELCRKHCMDLHSEHIPEGYEVACSDFVGYSTLIDSLAAVRKHVFEDRDISMDELLAALAADFEGYEKVQELLAHSPAYGNNDPYADSIGRDIDRVLEEYSLAHKEELGFLMQIRYVTVTAHVPNGRVVSATPNGRKAWTPLSEGASAGYSTDAHGPTALLLSNAAVKNRDLIARAGRVLNIKFSPKTLEGKAGTRHLVDFIRTFIDLKLWHVQFNIVNRATLLRAKKEPQKYRNLIVRVAGYSAFFVDLTSDLQDDIINRTEQDNI